MVSCSPADNRCSKDQYYRQFKKWSLKKNSKEEEWRFVAYRREKRKREGKDPGEVSMHGTHIPNAKVRKETARYVSLSSQYLGLDDSCMHLRLMTL